MKRSIYPLYAAADEGRVKPILDALKEKGVTVQKASPGKRDTLVLFLSENLGGESPEESAFFRLSAGRELVIPVNLDGCTPPEELQSALMARHALDGAKYGPEELAERIAKAVGGSGGSKLPLALSLLGVLALLVVGGLIAWNRMGKPDLRTVFAQATATPEPTATPTPAPTATPTPSPTPAPTVDGIDVELTKVAEVVYVGDIFKYYRMSDGIGGYSQFGSDDERQSYHEVAYNNGPMDHFYSTETGQEIPMVELGDVSYLAYLPNLMHVTFVNVKVALPDLSALEHLKSVTIIHCDIPDIEGLKGAAIQRFEYHGDTVTDFSPLSGCGKLSNVNLSPWNEQVDLGELRLPALRWLTVCGKVTGLGGLDRSDRLQDVHLQNTYLADLSCLQGLKLEQVRLDDNRRLTSLHGLEGMRTLKYLNIENSPRIRDISALEGCSSLTDFHAGGDWMDYLTDVSVLGTLPRLQNIGLYGVSVNDLNFLQDLSIKKNINLGFCINRGADLSGLGAVDTYSYLHVNTHGNYAAAAPYLEGKTVRQLMIYDGGNVDLSMLPDVTSELDLCECQNRDLTGLSPMDKVSMLWIKNCPYFSSFEGIEDLPKMGRSGSMLTVENCPRLLNWSGIEGKTFHRIELKGVFTLPDFAALSFTELALEYLDKDTLPDLSCLNGLEQNGRYSFRFVGMDQIVDLSPLFRLYGHSLAVPPQVGDQALGLVDDGHFSQCEIVYPDGGWDPNSVQVELLSLDELDTLPPSILKHVKRLTLAGDTIVPDEEAWVEEDYSTYPPALYLHYDGEEERIPVEPGTLTDLSILSKLTGLEGLTVYAQPRLVSLEGIQNMGELQRLNIHTAPALTDASAAFTVQSLEELSLRFTAISSVQGVQNLYALKRLDVNDSPVADLSPLTACPALEEVNFFLPMMTFETLKVQPAVVRENIRSLSIAGAYVYDGGPWWFEEDCVTDPPQLYLHSNETDERLPLTEGAVTDMGSLAALLPNMERLGLYGQPLVTLDGVENFEGLWRISIEECRSITDYSALWNVATLGEVSLRNQSIGSIEGIENLPHLVNLSLSGARVTDFSPLARVDYSYCTSEECDGWGFSLALDVAASNELTYEDYEPLEAVPVYWGLNMNNVHVDKWLGHIMDKEMHELSCFQCDMSNEQLRSFVEAHPMLEQLDLRWNPQLTDLRCLLELKDLRRVQVSQNMSKAIASLGEGYGFELIVE